MAGTSNSSRRAGGNRSSRCASRRTAIRPRRLETAAGRRSCGTGNSHDPVADVGQRICRRASETGAFEDNRTDRPRRTNSGPIRDRGGRYRETSNAATPPAGETLLPQPAPGAVPRRQAVSQHRAASGVGKRHGGAGVGGGSVDGRSVRRRMLSAAFAGCRSLQPMALLRTGQKSPVERFVLPVIFRQRQGRDRFGHFVSEIKGMARVEVPRPRGQQLLEEHKRIGVGQMQAGADDVNLPVLGENAIVVVLDLAASRFNSSSPNRAGSAPRSITSRGSTCFGNVRCRTA